MEYLTTHDLVWVNETVTGKALPFNYVTLEAAMAGQYGYGAQPDALAQAGRLLERLVRKKPFAYGNRRTAFIATLSFLNANGHAITATDTEATQMLLDMEQGRISAEQAIAQISAPAGGGLPAGLTLRKLIMHECNHHIEALKALAPGD